MLFFQSVFQAGERAKGKGQRMRAKSFSFCGFVLSGGDATRFLLLAGQNCVMWLPLTVRELEIFIYFFSLFKAGKISALNKSGVLLVKNKKRMCIGLETTRACHTNEETGPKRC